MEPINYLPMQQINPLAQLMQGLQTGASLRQIREQRTAEEQSAQLKEQFKADFTDYMSAPSYERLTALQVKYPGMSDALKPLVANMDKKQLQSDLGATYQALSAIRSGKPDIALSTVDNYIKAAENSGIDTSKLIQIRTAIETNPDGAATQIEAMAGLIDPEGYKKFTEAQAKSAETTREERLFPSKLAEAQAKADIEGVKAKYIEPQTIQDIQAKGISMKKMLADIDIARQNSRIAAMQASIAKEGNLLKREELRLKVMEAQDKLSTTLRERAGEVEGALSTSDNVLNTIDRIMRVPKKVKESAHGPISSKIPTLSADTADYEALMETLGSQAFLSQVSALKGMGALSDAEGKKLQAGMQNLSLTQSADQAERNVKEMQKIMLKARKNLEKRYGIVAPEPEYQTERRAREAGVRGINPPPPLVPTGKAKSIMNQADMIIYGGK